MTDILAPHLKGSLALVVDDTPERYAILEGFLQRRFPLAEVRLPPRCPRTSGKQAW